VNTSTVSGDDAAASRVIARRQARRGHVVDVRALGVGRVGGLPRRPGGGHDGADGPLDEQFFLAYDHGDRRYCHARSLATG